VSARSEMLRDLRAEMFDEQEGKCSSCGLLMTGKMELAHRIPDTVWARKKYGRRVIDHRFNKTLTHPGACNDRQNIQNWPVRCDALAKRIRKEIEHGS
jgi:hypothetical protein